MSTFNPEHINDTTNEVEQIIRDIAGNVVNAAQARKDHPTYGYTKASIRTTGDKMEGAIAVFQILARQAANHNVTSLAEFNIHATTEAVEAARAALVAL